MPTVAVTIGILGSTGIVQKLFFLSQITKLAAFADLIHFCFFLVSIPNISQDFVVFVIYCRALITLRIFSHVGSIREEGG